MRFSSHSPQFNEIFGPKLSISLNISAEKKLMNFHEKVKSRLITFVVPGASLLSSVELVIFGRLIFGLSSTVVSSSTVESIVSSVSCSLDSTLVTSVSWSLITRSEGSVLVLFSS